ncbi:MAG: S16 family serine protease [Candidatus Pacearchaeota archaeon]
MSGRVMGGRVGEKIKNNAKDQSTKKVEIAFIILIVCIFILAGLLIYAFYFYARPEKPETNESTEVVVHPSSKSYSQACGPIAYENATIKSMKVPAVDRDGKGAMTEITVEVFPGHGRVLVDINNLLFWEDTQESIRKAREVAQDFTGLNLSNYDLIYHISANANVVGGPSAGAALTVLTIAALQNKSIRNDTTITGVINYDGTIGPVSEVMQKAKILGKYNITNFLVPLGQSKEIDYDERKVCKTYGYLEYCTIERIPKLINLSEMLGINVIEVLNINQTINYMLV